MVNKYAVILSGILLIVILLILLLNSLTKNVYESNINNKNAIVVLTRGYKNNQDYISLIDRNNAIYEVYYKKLSNPENMDIIIFHEGNITNQQQSYIQSETPNLPLQFIAIKFYNNTTINEKCPQIGWANAFNMGYKNMCYFWSIDFLKYLKDYEYIIRIDEDCIIRKLDSNILNEYSDNNIIFACASDHIGGNIDEPDVIIGMIDLFKEFIEKNEITPYSSYNEIRCPYTNVMIVNVPFFNNNEIVMSILKEIELSNCIFSNRWGDLPIWGCILSLLVDDKYYLKDTDITYNHGSHGQDINP